MTKHSDPVIVVARGVSVRERISRSSWVWTTTPRDVTCKSSNFREEKISRMLQVVSYSDRLPVIKGQFRIRRQRPLTAGGFMGVANSDQS